MDSEKANIITKILTSAGCSSWYLFGSYATGKNTADSDIDIGVKGLPPSLFFKTYATLENALDMKVDLVDFDAQKDFFEILSRINEIQCGYENGQQYI